MLCVSLSRSARPLAGALLLALAACAATPPRLAPAPAMPSAAATPTPTSPPPTRAPAPAAAAAPTDTNADFDRWLAGYRTAALARGIRAATLDSALAGLTPSPRVVELDRSQPGDSGAANRPPPRLAAYLASHVDTARVARGQVAAERLAPALAAITGRTGVPAGIIVGIWGAETNYGGFTGDFDIVRALATLAWDGRRRTLFTGELDAVLAIIDRGLASRDQLKGSWAGAMGQPQFLPSSYLAYAADGDGDGRADIWGSEADTAASIARYLEQHGWQRGLPWGIAVTVPAGLDRAALRNPEPPRTCVRPLERHSKPLTVAEWRALGLASPAAFPADSTPMTLIEADGPGEAAYLVTANYRAILAYNCSNYYALSVALLGDAIVAPR